MKAGIRPASERSIADFRAGFILMHLFISVEIIIKVSGEHSMAMMKHENN